MPDRYAFYQWVDSWPELTNALNLLQEKLRAVGRPKAADMIAKAYVTTMRELVDMGVEMSVFATTALRQSEKATRVRPDTEGGGGPRLSDSLVAEPLLPGLTPGAIGVANETKLDAEVPWWPTNEIGSDARIGGVLRGYFYDDATGDAAPPSEQEFRVHPLFEPDRASPVSGFGIIKEPIPARRFIEATVPVVNREWQARHATIKAAYAIAFDAAMATMA